MALMKPPATAYNKVHESSTHALPQSVYKGAHSYFCHNVVIASYMTLHADLISELIEDCHNGSSYCTNKL